MVSKGEGYAYLTNTSSADHFDVPNFIDIGLDAVLASTNSLIAGGVTNKESIQSGGFTSFLYTQQPVVNNRKPKRQTKGEQELQSLTLKNERTIQPSTPIQTTKLSSSKSFSRSKQLTPIESLPPLPISPTKSERSVAGYSSPKFSAFKEFSQKCLSDVDMKRKILSSDQFKEVRLFLQQISFSLFDSIYSDRPCEAIHQVLFSVTTPILSHSSCLKGSASAKMFSLISQF